MITVIVRDGGYFVGGFEYSLYELIQMQEQGEVLNILDGEDHD